MTQQYGLIRIITDPADETRCSEECPHRRILHGHAKCTAFGSARVNYVRCLDCLSATTAAREMEARAFENGFGVAAREAYAESQPPSIWRRATVNWSIATSVLDAELARIRGGGR